MLTFLCLLSILTLLGVVALLGTQRRQSRDVREALDRMSKRNENATRQQMGHERVVQKQLEHFSHVEGSITAHVKTLSDRLAPRPVHWGVQLIGPCADGSEPVSLAKSGCSLPGSVEVHALTVPKGLAEGGTLAVWGPALLSAVQINDSRVLDSKAPLHCFTRTLGPGQKLIFQITVL